MSSASSTRIATTVPAHEGWSNYPTWVVDLWLSNDQTLYNAAMQLTRSETQMYDSDYFRQKDVPRHAVAGALERFVRDELPADMLEANPAADLLGWAMAYVNWVEIAEQWIERLNESVAVL